MSSGSPRENKSIKDIYIGLIVLCGIVACVWASSANRFRYVEILGITIAGAVIGSCLGRVIHGILMYLRNDKKKQKVSEAHCGCDESQQPVLVLLIFEKSLNIVKIVKNRLLRKRLLRNRSFYTIIVKNNVFLRRKFYFSQLFCMFEQN